MNAKAIVELADEDWKTQSARKYPNVPAGAVIEVVEEGYVNFYGGPWTRIRYNGELYWVDPMKLEKM